MGKFEDKVVIVTGASRGIGKAIAVAFAKEGADIVVNYHKSEKSAKEVCREIKKFGREGIPIQANVADENDVKDLVEKTMKHFKRIDILVNNAGVVFDVPFKERTFHHWERTLHTNLIGTFLMCKEVALYMNRGKIVNISSTNGINSFSPDTMDYDASKAGINILTRNLAKELAPKIQVNSVAPGWVDTDMNKYLPKDFVKKETEKIYLKRFAKPQEIANVVLFLASDDASFITGSILKVDGGYG